MTTPTLEALPPLPAKLKTLLDCLPTSPFKLLLTAEIDAYARASIAMGEGEPVYWEWRHMGSHPDAVDFGQWSEWKRVEGRSPIHTAEDELNDFRAYIARGQKYELRALYTAQPAPAAPVSDEREAFEATFPPIKSAVQWDGSRYVVDTEWINSYAVDRFIGQWDAWQARASLRPAPAQPMSEDEVDGVPSHLVPRLIKGVVDNAAMRKAAKQAEPVHVEVVGEVVTTDDGNDVRWSIEGGADAIPEGVVLLISDRPITDDTGSGEVYTHAQSAPAQPMSFEQRQGAFLASKIINTSYRTAFMLGIQSAEAHHFGITAQAGEAS